VNCELCKTEMYWFGSYPLHIDTVNVIMYCTKCNKKFDTIMTDEVHLDWAMKPKKKWIS
jgi:hypothetical protein